MLEHRLGVLAFAVAFTSFSSLGCPSNSNSTDLRPTDDASSGEDAASKNDAASASDASFGNDASSPSDAANAPDASSVSPDGGALPFLDLPFSYAIEDDWVVIHTDGGDLYTSLGPWGAHFNPNAGHSFGDAKSNIAAYFTPDLTELTDINGGPCNVGDSCQLAEAVLTSKVPTYIAPIAGVLTEVAQEHPSATFYPNQVQVGLRMHAGAYEFLFGHMGSIAPGLRDKILQATGINVDDWQEGGMGLVTGLNIPVAAGEALGRPQVVAAPAPTPGYFQGSGVIWVPWIEIEFFLSVAGETLCYYDALTPAAKSALQATLDRDMADLDSVRYGPPWFQASKWKWGAEGRLCSAHSVFPMDFSSLRTNLGGWFQRPPNGDPAEEVLAFVSIAKDTATYDPSRYSSPSTSTLVIRSKPYVGGIPYSFVLPDATTIEVNRLDGELLEESNDALLVRWRDVHDQQVTLDLYQRAAYRLGPDGLTVRWGEVATAADQAAAPTLDLADTCLSAGVDCYDHEPTGHF